MFTSSIKREIGKFYVAVVQRQERNVQKKRDAGAKLLFCQSKPMERFHSRGQHLCKFIGTKESVCIKREFTSHRTVLLHQRGHRFIVLGHQYGRRDVMRKHCIAFLPFSCTSPSSLLKLPNSDFLAAYSQANQIGEFYCSYH